MLRKPARPDVLLRVRRPGRACHAERLALDAGDSSLDVSLPKAARLVGSVAGESGAPLAHARVDLLTRGGRDSLALTADASGAFAIALDPGSFELRARADPEHGERAACSRPASSGPCARCGWRARRVARRSGCRARDARARARVPRRRPRARPDMVELRVEHAERTQVFGSTRRTVAGSPSPSAARSPSRSGCPASGPGDRRGRARLRPEPARPACAAGLGHVPARRPAGTSLAEVRAGICTQGLAFVPS